MGCKCEICIKDAIEYLLLKVIIIIITSIVVI